MSDGYDDLLGPGHDWKWAVWGMRRGHIVYRMDGRGMWRMNKFGVLLKTVFVRTPKRGFHCAFRPEKQYRGMNRTKGWRLI